MNDVLQRVSGESQPVPLWRTASTEDLDTVKEKEVPLLYSFCLNLKVTILEAVVILNYILDVFQSCHVREKSGKINFSSKFRKMLGKF